MIKARRMTGVDGVMIKAESGTGNVSFQAAALEGAPTIVELTLPFTDDFSDGDMDGWSFVDQTTRASDWRVIDGSLRQNTRVLGSGSPGRDQTYRLGTYAYLASGSTLTDYRFSVEAEYLLPFVLNEEGVRSADDIGILFRYRNPNNFYRLSINSRNGFTRLEKRLDGVYSALATDARGYLRGETLDLDVEVKGARIFVWRNGDPLFAVEDASHLAGTVALYSQDQARFDNVSIQQTGSAPNIFLSSPLAYLTSSGQSIRAIALASNSPANATVEFLLNGVSMAMDQSPPFQADFTALAPGNYELVALLRDGFGAELGIDTNSVVGVGGEYLVAVGDSITLGYGDNYLGIVPSGLGRLISFQGFERELTDLLDDVGATANNMVFNEGIGGDTAYNAAYLRVDSIKARHPEMDTALVMLGTNDASNFIPSGLGCSGATCNGTFAENMQTLVDKLASAGVAPVVALPPPVFNSTTPFTSATNNRIRDYISVIQDEIAGISVGPDFFSFFMPSAEENYSSLFSDALHPNGLGYKVMSYLWHNALSPTTTLPLPFVLGNLSLATGESVQQNLLQVGNPYYIDESFVLESVPAALAKGRWIMTANGDVNDTSESYVSFEVDRDVDIYVAYAANATSLPAWLSGYVDSGLTVTTSNLSSSSLRLYRTQVDVEGAPVTVSLGANSGASTGADANYVVIVVEQ